MTRRNICYEHREPRRPEIGSHAKSKLGSAGRSRSPTVDIDDAKALWEHRSDVGHGGDARSLHGLLTFALVEEGLKTRAARVSLGTGDLGVRDWLEYGVQRVSKLQRTWASQSRRLEHGTEQDFLGSLSSATQEPRVFYRGDSPRLSSPRLRPSPEAGGCPTFMNGERDQFFAGACLAQQ